MEIYIYEIIPVNDFTEYFTYYYKCDLRQIPIIFFVRVGGCYPYWYMHLFHPVWYFFVPKGGRGGLQTLKFPILVKK